METANRLTGFIYHVFNQVFFFILALLIILIFNFSNRLLQTGVSVCWGGLLQMSDNQNQSESELHIK